MICFDTTVLIWGVQQKAVPGQEGRVERTKRYIDSLHESNEQIMVPTPVLAEYLQFFDTEERKRQLRTLEKYFFVPAFNLPAAYLAAGLAHKHQAQGGERSDGTSRQELKTDFQIIATAIVNGAALLVTDNLEDFTRLADLAGGRIKVSDVPNVHKQLDLDV